MGNKNCNCDTCNCDDLVLADLLLSEKNMAVNLSIALNEMSNIDLYNKIFAMFKEVSKETKNLFQILYSNGYYQLEEEKINKIEEKVQSLNKKLSN